MKKRHARWIVEALPDVLPAEGGWTAREIHDCLEAATLRCFAMTRLQASLREALRRGIIQRRGTGRAGDAYRYTGRV